MIRLSIFCVCLRIWNKFDDENVKEEDKQHFSQNRFLRKAAVSRGRVFSEAAWLCRAASEKLQNIHHSVPNKRKEKRSKLLPI